MRQLLFLLFPVLASLMVLGCPLDIQVRCEESSDCGENEPTRCSTDSDCQDTERCHQQRLRCEVGPRLGEACREAFECPIFTVCHLERRRCEAPCVNDMSCPPGYRCSPDRLCVEECSDAPPETLGLTCETSMDCARCGFCVDSGGEQQCRQPCQLDRDCPGGAEGVCEQVGTSQLRACRPP